MSKMGQMEKIILDILSDNEWHTARELKEEIAKIDNDLLKDSNLIYVVLNRMKKVKEQIERGKAGEYRMKSYTSRTLNEIENKGKEKMLDQWKKFVDENTQEQSISINMTIDEFYEAKWTHELTVKIEEFIKNFTLDDESENYKK